MNSAYDYDLPIWREDAARCEECGEYLDEDNYCTGCGAQYNDGSDADDYYVNLREGS